MPLAFTQSDIEREISDVIPHGKRREIARLTHIYEAVLYGWLNPDDERKSPQYQTLAIQAAMDETDTAMADAHWAKMNALRDASRPHSFTRQRLDAGLELGNLSSGMAGIIADHLKGQPLPVKLRRIAELKRQIETYERSILETIGRTGK